MLMTFLFSFNKIICPCSKLCWRKNQEFKAKVNQPWYCLTNKPTTKTRCTSGSLFMALNFIEWDFLLPGSVFYYEIPDALPT